MKAWPSISPASETTPQMSAAPVSACSRPSRQEFLGRLGPGAVEVGDGLGQRLVEVEHSGRIGDSEAAEMHVTGPASLGREADRTPERCGRRGRGAGRGLLEATGGRGHATAGALGATEAGAA